MTLARCAPALLLLLPLACSDSSGDAGNDSFASADTSSTADDEVGTDESGSTDGTEDGTDDATTSDTTDEGTTTDDGTTDDGTTDDTTTDDGTTDDTTTDDGTTDDTTGETTGDTSDDGMACDEFSVTLDPLTPSVMLVLDKSGSMFSNTWDHDNNGGTPQITRWSSLHQVADTLLSSFDSKVNFGSVLFPSTDAQNVYGPSACITNDFPEVAVAANNGPDILASIPPANTINSFGATPSTLGIQAAYDHLANQNPNNPRALILVTDGAANCNQNANTNFELIEVYDDDLPALVQTAFDDDGIPTYVVGIDITDAVINDGIGGDPNNINPADKLNEVAALGGSGSFFNSQDQDELEGALEDVLLNVASCVIPLEVEPVFEEFTEVYIDGMEWPMVMDCQSEDGWVYTNPNGPYDEIELCGLACDAVKLHGEADIEYHCTPG